MRRCYETDTIKLGQRVVFDVTPEPVREIVISFNEARTLVLSEYEAQQVLRQLEELV